jgi:hypothetical protein
MLFDVNPFCDAESGVTPSEDVVIWFDGLHAGTDPTPRGGT